MNYSINSKYFMQTDKAHKEREKVSFQRKIHVYCNQQFCFDEVQQQSVDFNAISNQ